mmetsp:Transcript_121181/g.287857  ORF Transcript_121181/g.287857 Transcript_121181/m.287857 type:complete len:233 (+) Transcript_121181:47-745(+)
MVSVCSVEGSTAFFALFPLILLQCFLDLASSMFIFPRGELLHKLLFGATKLLELLVPCTIAAVTAILFEDQNIRIRLVLVQPVRSHLLTLIILQTFKLQQFLHRHAAILHHPSQQLPLGCKSFVLAADLEIHLDDTRALRQFILVHQHLILLCGHVHDDRSIELLHSILDLLVNRFLPEISKEGSLAVLELCAQAHRQAERLNLIIRSQESVETGENSHVGVGPLRVVLVER